MAVDDDLKLVVRSLKERYRGNLFFGFIGFYTRNWVRIRFGRWRRTTRRASASLDAGKLKLTDLMTRANTLADQLTIINRRLGE